MAEAEARTAERGRGRRTDVDARSPAMPDYYIGMGQTAENVAQYENVSREEQDEFAALSQQRATAAQERGFFEREITPASTPSTPTATR